MSSSFSSDDDLRDRADASVDEGAGFVASEWMRSQHSVLAYLVSTVSDFHLAEDLLQEVAAIVVANHKKFDRERSFTAWCIGIAKNVARSHYRKAGSSMAIADFTVLELMADAATRVSETADDRRSALRTCVERLPKRTRELLRLRYEGDLKPEKIAEMAGLSRSNVNVILHRARIALAECVSARLEQPT